MYSRSSSWTYLSTGFVFTPFSSNVSDEWVEFLFSIQKALSSNLNLEAGYNTFAWASPSSLSTARCHLQIRRDHFITNPYHFSTAASVLPFGATYSVSRVYVLSTFVFICQGARFYKFHVRNIKNKQGRQYTCIVTLLRDRVTTVFIETRQSLCTVDLHVAVNKVINTESTTMYSLHCCTTYFST